MFFCFEGLDGSGKSTQLTMLAEGLRAQGRDLLTIREPGGTRLGEAVRGILLDKEQHQMQPEAELLLFTAARNQLVKEVIEPALRAGKIVLSDRFYWSTFAYQGYARGIDLEIIKMLTQFACHGLQPRQTFLLDVPLHMMKQRHGAMAKEHDRMESSGDLFYEKVRNAYLSLAKLYPSQITQLDGSLGATVLAKSILNQVMEQLNSGEGARDSRLASY